VGWTCNQVTLPESALADVFAVDVARLATQELADRGQARCGGNLWPVMLVPTGSTGMAALDTRFWPACVMAELIPVDGSAPFRG